MGGSDLRPPFSPQEHWGDLPIVPLSLLNITPERMDPPKLESIDCWHDLEFTVGLLLNSRGNTLALLEGHVHDCPDGTTAGVLLAFQGPSLSYLDVAP
eukprot:2861186-Alexandrium_andersonii.AAC.1